MKLVELLAAHVKEWDESTQCIYQDGNDTVLCVRRGVPKYKEDWDAWDVSPESVVLNYGDSIYGAEIGLASDYAEVLIDRAQWQAERDRQKGGEWIRNRGKSKKAPVDIGTMVEVRFRNGLIEQDNGYPRWHHDGTEFDIMAFRVISQPQAEEVKLSKAEARAQFMPEPEFVYLEAKTDQIDGPIRWRDTVNELDAYIEEFTREREALINRLAEEGFALIPGMHPVMGVANGSIPIEEWQVGDVIRVIRESSESCADAGRCYSITALDDIEPKYELDNNYYPRHEDMEFVSRP